MPVTPQNRTSLGKFVKSVCGDRGKQESRICNGRMIPIWCYPFPDTDVEKAVMQQAMQSKATWDEKPHHNTSLKAV